MYVGYGALELHLPQAHDLKSKRRVVRGLIDRLHARFRISVAETAHGDLRQRSQIGIAVVAKEASEVERILDQIVRVAESEVEAVILSWDPVLVEEKS